MGWWVNGDPGADLDEIRELHTSVPLDAAAPSLARSHRRFQPIEQCVVISHGRLQRGISDPLS